LMTTSVWAAEAIAGSPTESAKAQMTIDFIAISPLS